MKSNKKILTFFVIAFSYVSCSTTFAGQKFSFLKDPFQFFDLEWGSTKEAVIDFLKEEDLYDPVYCSYIGGKLFVPDIHGAILDYSGGYYFEFDEDDSLCGGYAVIDIDESDTEECYSAYQRIYEDCMEKYGVPQSSMMGVLPMPESESDFFDAVGELSGPSCYWCAEDLSMLCYSVIEMDQKLKYKLEYIPHTDEE